MGDIPKIRDLDDPAFNPFMADAAMFGAQPDPYPALAELRRKGPVHEGDYREFFGESRDITFPPGIRHFMVLGYDEVNQVLNDPATFTNQAYKFNIGLSFGESISTMDAPEHQRFRKIFQKAFLPNIVTQWGETLVGPIIEELIAKFRARGAADLIQEFTLYYPFQIIYRQLRLPEQDITTFHKLAITQTVVSFDKEHGMDANSKLGEYFTHMVEDRRRNPGDDLVSILSLAEVDGEKLPMNVLVSFLRQLVNAGGDTTYRTTSTLLTQLLCNPDQLDAVRKDRALVAQAIEETLRFDGPVLMQTRFAARDVVLGGVSIPAGSVIDAVAGAANHDEKVFPEPEKFNIFRPKGMRHFGFAAGPHICIGQHLARLEMSRALNGVLDHLPNLRLDPSKPAPQSYGTMMRTPHHLHVLFDPG
jgi:cytochrome P450